MARHEEFSVELEGPPVRARLALPEATGERRSWGVVLLVHGAPGIGAESEDLFVRMTDALVDAGLAVVTIATGSAGAPGARLAVEGVDDAAAVLHGLALRDELDLDRIGVVGQSLGAIVVARLARRTDQIARVALVSPVTIAEVSARLGSETAGEVAVRLGASGAPPGYFDGLSTLTPAVDLTIHDRPTLILHGAADRVVPPEASFEYRDALEAAGRRVDHVLVALGDHVFSSVQSREACLDRLSRFFAAMAPAAGAARR